MSRSTYGARNIQAAREYIAELRHSYPELQNINPQSDAQVVRYANAAHRYEQAGLTPTPQALRGHETTPERPGAPIKPLAPEYARYRQERATALPANVKQFGNGALSVEGHKKDDVIPALKAAGNRTITSVSVRDKDGYWHSIETRLKASDVLAMLKAGTWRQFVTDMAAKKYKNMKLGRTATAAFHFAA